MGVAVKKIVIIGVLVLAGMTAEVITTRDGSRLTPDSIVYLATARGLIGQQTPPFTPELFAPAAHFPPLYPICLALSAKLTGADVLIVARWLNIGLLGITLLLVGGLAFRYSRRLIVSGLALFFVLNQPETLYLFGATLSEPLFIVWLLLTLWLLLEDRAAAAGICAGLSFLTRYIGIGIVLGGVLGLLLLSRAHWRIRLRRVFVFGALSLAPMLIWIVQSAAGLLADRHIFWHPIGLAHLDSGLRAISRWFLLDTAPPGAQIAVLLCIGVGVVVLLRFLHLAPSQQKLLRWIGLIGLMYLIGLIVSISLFDAATPLDDRLLIPLFIMGVIGLAVLAPRFRIETALVVSVFAALYGLAGLGSMAQGALIGTNYAVRWAQSPLLATLKTLPPDQLIVTNTPEVLYLYLPRPTEPLPTRFDPNSLQPNRQYADQMATLQAQLMAHRAVIVFWRETVRPFYPSEDMLRTELSLTAVFESGEGAIYVTPNAAP